MKQVIRFLSAFVVALTLTDCRRLRIDAKAGGNREYVDDSVVTSKVKAAILNEPGLKSAEINVETFKGVVQLSGFVEFPVPKLTKRLRWHAALAA